MSYMCVFVYRILYVPVEFENNREILPKIGDKIRKLRLSKNLSQSQLAYEVGTTLRQIQRIEVGTFNVGILYYIQIAKVLEADFQDFFESL